MKDASEEAEVTEHTAIDMYQWLREVCSDTLVHGPPIILGGQQVVVQIDESLFRHKPKVSKNIFKNIINIILQHTYNPIASSRESNHKRSVGFRDGGHIPCTSPGIHGDCPEV